MKRKWGKLVAILIIVSSMIFICTNSYAHSGRTDSSGGHKDNKNKSGLGYYHYHCGGHPAHLHKNGVCPYSKSSSKSSKSTLKSKKTSSSTKKNNTTVTTKETSNSNEKNNTTSTNAKSSTNTTTTTLTSTPISKETSSTQATISKVNKNENNTNTANSSTEYSSAVGTLVALGLLGGGSYLGYKKYKKSKE